MDGTLFTTHHLGQKVIGSLVFATLAVASRACGLRKRFANRFMLLYSLGTKNATLVGVVLGAARSRAGRYALSDFRATANAASTPAM